MRNVRISISASLLAMILLIVTTSCAPSNQKSSLQHIEAAGCRDINSGIDTNEFANNLLLKEYLGEYYSNTISGKLNKSQIHKTILNYADNVTISISNNTSSNPCVVIQASFLMGAKDIYNPSVIGKYCKHHNKANTSLVAETKSEFVRILLSADNSAVEPIASMLGLDKARKSQLNEELLMKRIEEKRKTPNGFANETVCTELQVIPLELLAEILMQEGRVKR